MKIDSFYRNSFIVIISNLFTGIISFIFSIILSRKLGTEGLGLYGLIMPVYFLLLCLVSEGLVTAVSKVTAVYFSKRDFRNLNRTIKTVFYFIFIWVAFVSLVVFISSNVIGTVIINDPRSSLAIKVLCPALFFVPFSAILKGYFYGTSKFNVTAITDIFEKALRVAAFVGIIKIFSLNGVRDTVAAAYTAITLGEFTSFSILFVLYKRYKNNYVSYASKRQSRIQLLFDVLAISFPLCINGFLSSILSSLSALVLPRMLVRAGMTYKSALSLIGSFSGMALGITLFPMIIVNSISTVLIPDLSISLSRKDYWSTENRIRQVFKVALLVAISALVVNQCIPDVLGRLLYNRNDLETYIRYASFCSVLCFLSSPSFGMLNGLGKQKVLLRNSLIVSVEELILILLLTGIPAINIYGLGISLIATSCTSLVLNYREIKKICNPGFPVSRLVLYLSIGALSYIVVSNIASLFPNDLLLIKATFVILSGFLLVFYLARTLEKFFD